MGRTIQGKQDAVVRMAQTPLTLVRLTFILVFPFKPLAAATYCAPILRVRPGAGSEDPWLSITVFKWVRLFRCYVLSVVHDWSSCLIAKLTGFSKRPGMSALGHQRTLSLILAQCPLLSVKRSSCDDRNHFLYLCLLSQFQRIVHFNTEISNRAFEFCMPKKQLYRSEILGPPVYQ